MSKIPSPHFQRESWAIVFSISSFTNFRIVYIWITYQSLDKRILFTILFFFHPKESCAVFEILIFFRWGTHLYPTFSRPSVHPSVCRVPYLRYHTSSNHHLWYTCVKWWYLQAFFPFFFFWNFDFLGCYRG